MINAMDAMSAQRAVHRRAKAGPIWLCETDIEPAVGRRVSCGGRSVPHRPVDRFLIGLSRQVETEVCDIAPNVHRKTRIWTVRADFCVRPFHQNCRSL